MVPLSKLINERNHPMNESNAKEAQKKKIMIVDDETSFTRLVSMNLKATNRFEVQECNKAVKAVTMAKEFQPDLILLDVIMPRMDGGEVANRIQAKPGLEKTPIIFLTATVAQRENGDIGGFPFLAKPVNAKKLIETIDETLAARG